MLYLLSNSWNLKKLNDTENTGADVVGWCFFFKKKLNVSLYILWKFVLLKCFIFFPSLTLRAVYLRCRYGSSEKRHITAAESLSKRWVFHLFIIKCIIHLFIITNLSLRANIGQQDQVRPFRHRRSLSHKALKAEFLARRQRPTDPWIGKLGKGGLWPVLAGWHWPSLQPGPKRWDWRVQ